MKKITFKEVKEGVTNWYQIAKSLEKSNLLFNHLLKFELIDVFYDVLKAEKELKIYLGYKQKDINPKSDIKEIVSNFFIVVIPDSLDKQKNYEKDQLPEGVLSFTALYAPLASTEISSKEALERMKHWHNAEIRTHTFANLKSSPLLFQIPKENISSKAEANFIYLGLVNKATKEEKDSNFQYDLLVEQVFTKLEQSQSFYDTARPVPPFKPTIDAGLYKYLELDLQ